MQPMALPQMPPAPGADGYGRPMPSTAASYQPPSPVLANPPPNGSSNPLPHRPPLPPNSRYKTYQAPSYAWDIGNFRQCGPMGMCVSPHDAPHSFIVAALAITPAVIFLAAVRSSTDYASLAVVPALLVGLLLCLLFATTCDPGIYRKRVVTDADRERVERQQLARENEIRATRGLPPRLPNPQAGRGGVSAVVPAGGGQCPIAAESNAVEGRDDNNGDAIVEVSDEEHPFRLDFSRRVFMPVAPPPGEGCLGGGGGRRSTAGHDKEDAPLFAIECNMCTACGIVKGPRVAHCFVCNVCVDEFDHHCGVLGSCVARRTFRFFAGAVVFVALLAVYVGVMCVVVLASDIDYSESFKSHSGRFRVVAAGLIALGCSCALCPTVPLTFVYLRLACINSTQKQDGTVYSRASDAPAAAAGHPVPTVDPYRGRCMPLNCLCRCFGPLGRSRADAWHSRGRHYPTPD